MPGQLSVGASGRPRIYICVYDTVMADNYDPSVLLAAVKALIEHQRQNEMIMRAAEAVIETLFDSLDGDFGDEEETEDAGERMVCLSL